MLTLEPENFPLTKDSSGTIYVGNTRVTLDTLINCFKNGATAEQIALRFPAVKLSDVYATITYYLRHQEDVESYLHERQQQAQTIEQEIKTQFNSNGIRERLLARQQS